jgi:hypothetical protein
MELKSAISSVFLHAGKHLKVSPFFQKLKGMKGGCGFSGPGLAVKPGMNGLVFLNNRGQAAQDLLSLGFPCLELVGHIAFSQGVVVND